ncbi:MAG: hypothetical protein HY399_02000 [Elusimicrobia bacterium]|nr:hypothetical protein [Elusimicrobiota bacterium]
MSSSWSTLSVQDQLNLLNQKLDKVQLQLNVVLEKLQSQSPGTASSSKTQKTEEINKKPPIFPI